MADYRPRRAAPKWLDGQCPRGVLAIFDEGPATLDRYTIFYTTPLTGTTRADMWLAYLGCSAMPTHPQGVGTHGEMPAHEVAAFRYRRKHRMCRWSDLPAEVQRVARRDCAELVGE